MSPRLVLAAAAALGLLSLAACGDGFSDRIIPTADPCVFVLDFAPRCMPGGRTSICGQRRPVLARSEAPECRLPPA